MLKKQEEKQELCPYDKKPCKTHTQYVKKCNEEVRRQAWQMDTLDLAMLLKSCKVRHSCGRYAAYERSGFISSYCTGRKEFATGYKCPHNSEIDCGLFYRCDEFMRQEKDNKQLSRTEMQSGPDVCQVNPGLCPKYLEFEKQQKVR